MKVNVEKMFAQGTKKSFLKDKLDNIELDDATLLKPANFNLEFELLGEEIHVNGSFDTQLKLTCVRCLNEFEIDLDGQIESIYMLNEESVENEASSEAEYEFDDVIREFLKDGMIDVSELVREHVILEIPPYPVCHEDCEGLEESEKYKDDGTDPRWQQLLDITNKK